MIEVKNNQSISIAELQNVPYDFFMGNVVTQRFRCVGIAARRRDDVVDAFILMASASFSLYLEYVEFKLDKVYPSVGKVVPSWVNFERELAENFGVEYADNPWLKPIRFPKDACHKLSMAEYPFFKEKGSGVHEVAVGPVHAGVIEPGHFRFMCRGEKIDHLEIQLGYQHRGIEKLMCQGKNTSKRVLAESITSDSAVINSYLYFNILESAYGISVPERAAAIRTICIELEKAALHLSTLSGIANDIGYVMGAAFAGATRTYVINSLQSICGNRFGRGLMTLGGVAFDIDDELNKKLKDTLNMVHGRVVHLKNTMMESPGVRSRLELTGTVSKSVAEEIGLTGVAGRASGVDVDARYFMDNMFYENLHNQKSAFVHKGDVFSRTYQRLEDAIASLEFVLKMLLSMPEGEIVSSVQDGFKNDSLIFSVGEGPRGETVHMALTGSHADKPFAVYKLKDPSFINWFALALSVRNNQISDFPLCNKSFDLSYSGNDL
ncbi:MAG: NADH-quinone oxidoreductase subunit C [Lentisphaeria bacterium]|nr:NADH-quinone oxidoreductase subunit C [Lentisphaeria bacterium]